LYVSWTVTESSLRRAFERFGIVSEARVIPGPRQKHYGFITFNSEADAARALAGLNSQSLPSDPITVEYAQTEPRSHERAPRAPGGAHVDQPTNDGATERAGGGERGRGRGTRRGRCGRRRGGRGGVGGGRRGRGGNGNSGTADANATSLSSSSSTPAATSSAPTQ